MLESIYKKPSRSWKTDVKSNVMIMMMMLMMMMMMMMMIWILF